MVIEKSCSATVTILIDSKFIIIEKDKIEKKHRQHYKNYRIPEDK